MHANNFSNAMSVFKIELYAALQFSKSLTTRRPSACQQWYEFQRLKTLCYRHC